MTHWLQGVGVTVLIALTIGTATGRAADRIDVWPDLAPGESTRLTGEQQAFLPGEEPPVVRITGITCPTMTIHPAAEPNGTAVLILPGGGFGKVVTNKEGTEIAEWLNSLGVTAFVLSYRTKSGSADNGWHRPLQDAQRSVSLIRGRADEWPVRPDRIGIMGLSAGGQVAARLIHSTDQRSYSALDDLDKVPFRPDFAMLIYPWNLYDSERKSLAEGITVPDNCPPAFLVHTDDDRATSLGTVLWYAAMKQRGIPAELHVYSNGGHGYGLRPVSGSQISTWPDHASHWLTGSGYLAVPAIAPQR